MRETIHLESYETERCVLSSIILDPSLASRAASRLQPDDFGDAQHRAVFLALVRLSRANAPIDARTLFSECVRSGGVTASQIHDIIGHGATAAHYAYYEQRLVDLVSEVAIAKARTIEDIDEMQTAIATIRRRQEADGIREPHSGTLGEAAMRWIESQAHPESSGVPTFLPRFDTEIGGSLGFGEYVVVGALPGNGKTMFLLQSLKQSQRNHLRTALISQEMSFTSIGERVVAMAYGQWDGRAADAMAHVERTYGDILFRQTQPTADAICAEISDLHSKGVRVVAVDYLQLLRGSSKQDNRTTEMSRITEQVSSLAARLGVTVYMASQLNRSVMQSTPPIPRKHHLRDSGQIEASAHWIFMLRHPIKDTPDDQLKRAIDDQGLDCEPKELFEVYVEKVRNRELRATAFRCLLKATPLGFYPLPSAALQSVNSDFQDYGEKEDF